MAKVTFDIPDDLLQGFKQVLVIQRKKMAPVLRDAIAAYVSSARSGAINITYRDTSRNVSASAQEVIAGFKNAMLVKITAEDESEPDDDDEDLEP